MLSMEKIYFAFFCIGLLLIIFAGIVRYWFSKKTLLIEASLYCGGLTLLIVVNCWMIMKGVDKSQQKKENYYKYLVYKNIDCSNLSCQDSLKKYSLLIENK